MNSKEKAKFRSTSTWKKFRKLILLERDYTCDICGIRKTKGLQVHHHKPDQYKILKPKNFSLLCPFCHKNLERFISRTKNKINIDKVCENMKRIFLDSGGKTK